ncbi:MAG: ATP synthase F0 subunit A [Chloroflexi bacterium]|nr:ATP synthase F0 subunit A [Chloroflexota bacterium]|tara:strand:+ start:2962 stop:3807 length:846 start_codon:yes stop_codon:yes gene_type:complete
MLILAVVGILLGAIGSALLGNEYFVPVPEVHLAPQEVFTIGSFVITNTLLSAWLTTLVILLLFGLGTRKMRFVPGRLQGFLEFLIEALFGFVKGVAGEKYARKWFPLLATIFLFVAFNAWMALLPFYPTVGFTKDGADHITTHLFRSAGTDINMPLALAVIAFLFIEIWGFRVHGIGYLKEFIRIGNPIQMFIGLIELISHFIRLVSFTFRLFGNMLAGEIVLFMMTFLTIIITPVVFYGLEILVGGVQALVFMGLTLVFAVMAVATHGEHNHEDSEAESH